MADEERARDRNGRDESHGDPHDQEHRGTSAQAVGGSKTSDDVDEVEEIGTGQPPGNAAGKSVNNPDVGPSS